MLDDHLESRVTRQRLSSGPVAHHVGGFADSLRGLGSKPISIESRLRQLAGFTYSSAAGPHSGRLEYAELKREGSPSDRGGSQRAPHIPELRIHADMRCTAYQRLRAPPDPQ